MVTASAPGKIMLAGEYAVLLGGRALAVTIDKRLAVSATIKEAGYGARLASDLWEEPRQLSDEALASGVVEGGEPLAAAAAYGLKLFGIANIELSVRSELKVSYGVGSSSALRLSILLALNELAHASSRLPYLDVARHAWLLQRCAQTLASGYDVATQLAGGLVEFRNPAAQRAPISGEISGPMPAAAELWPVEITRHDRLLEPSRELVHPFVGGRGAPTGAVLTQTLGWLAQAGRLEALAQASEALVEAFYAALAQRSDAAALAGLVQAVREHRALFAGSPHDPEDLEDQLSRLPGFDRSWTFKPTGAGGEDAIILIGEPSSVAVATATLYRMGWDRMPARFCGDGAAVRSAE